MIRVLNKLALPCVAATLVLGCGGGGGSAPVVLEGVFVDSAVQGVRYESLDSNGSVTESGETDASGKFRYRAGERVRFSIGALSLPPVTGAAVVTPVDIAGSRRLDDAKVSNLALLLQSLDSDGDPSNGIVISSATKTAMTEARATEVLQAVNGVTTPAAFQSSATLTALSGVANGRPPVALADARTHLLDSLANLQPNRAIVAAVVPETFDGAVPQGDSNFRYKMPAALRFVGAGLDKGVTAEVTGACSSLTPVSVTATEAVFECTAQSVGPIEVKLKQSGEVIATYSEQIALPRVKFDVSVPGGVNGSFTVELEAAKAPISVNNFLRYVDAQYYDGTVFHRVYPGFMIQTGGFTFNNGYVDKPTLFDPIALERTTVTGLSNTLLTVAMARTTVPDSATSEFFINVENNQASLDTRTGSDGYAVFGRLVDYNLASNDPVIILLNSILSVEKVSNGFDQVATRPVNPPVITRAIRIR